MNKYAIGTSEHLAALCAAIRVVAQREGVPTRELSADAFEALSDEHGFKRHAWKSIGGFARVRELAHHDDETSAPTPTELARTSEVRRGLAHVRSLERKLGDRLDTVDAMRDALRDAVERVPPILTHKARIDIDDLPLPTDRETVLFLSDLHFGSLVDPREVPGARYGWAEAARRIAFCVREACAYKPQHRRGASLRIILGGDIIEGEIHGMRPSIAPLAEQIDGARQILTAAIDYCAQHFAEINVICTPGNHGRWAHRHGRAVEQKWDSLVTTLYRGIEHIFRGNSAITFDIPRTPYVTWKTPGGAWCAATHGDTVFHAGVPGKSVNVARIAQQLRQWNAARAHDEQIKVIALGHYHTPLVTQTEAGETLIVNGCGSGAAAYAQSLGIHGSNPRQLLWESTHDHAVGDVRFLDLALADDDASLDAIVPHPIAIGAA